MTSEAYEILAMFMRYVFVLIGGLILLRAFRWLMKDVRSYKQEMKHLPDAGLVGEVVDMRTGKTQPLPREGMIGSAAACDIRVRGAKVHRRHALFSFVDGKGLLITPVMRRRISLENVELNAPAYALHGSLLGLGECTLKVRLFAGLNVPHPNAFQADDMQGFAMPDEGDEAFPQNAFPLPAPGGFAVPESAYAAEAIAESETDFAYILHPGEAAGEYPPSQPPLSEASAPEDENNEALPYQSPIVRHRRRDRH